MLLGLKRIQQGDADGADLPADAGARQAAAGAALRALLARLARGWEGRSNRWERDARYLEQVKAVRESFQAAARECP